MTDDAGREAAPAAVHEAANAELHNAAHTMSEHDQEVRFAVKIGRRKQHMQLVVGSHVC